MKVMALPLPAKQKAEKNSTTFQQFYPQRITLATYADTNIRVQTQVD